MGIKSMVAVLLSFAGGVLVGYGYGVKTVINSMLEPIPEITASLVGAFTWGVGSGVGREIGNDLVDEIWKMAIETYGDPNQLLYIGLVLALIGIFIGFVIEEENLTLKI